MVSGKRWGRLERRVAAVTSADTHEDLTAEIEELVQAMEQRQAARSRLAAAAYSVNYRRKPAVRARDIVHLPPPRRRRA